MYVPLLCRSLFFISVSFVAKGQVRRRYTSISSVCKEVRKLEFLSVCLLLHMLANWTICTSVRSLSLSLSLCLCVCVSFSIGLECVEVKPFWSDIPFVHITMLKFQRHP